jgi:putative transposase
VLSEHGVPIAPRTFHAWAVRAPSKRALWDATITEVLAGYYEPDEHGRKQTGVVVRVVEDVGAPAA